MPPARPLASLPRSDPGRRLPSRAEGRRLIAAIDDIGGGMNGVDRKNYTRNQPPQQPSDRPGGVFSQLGKLNRPLAGDVALDSGALVRIRCVAGGGTPTPEPWARPV